MAREHIAAIGNCWLPHCSIVSVAIARSGHWSCYSVTLPVVAVAVHWSPAPSAMNAVAWTYLASEISHRGFEPAMSIELRTLAYVPTNSRCVLAIQQFSDLPKGPSRWGPSSTLLVPPTDYHIGSAVRPNDRRPMYFVPAIPKPSGTAWPLRSNLVIHYCWPPLTPCGWSATFRPDVQHSRHKCSIGLRFGPPISWHRCRHCLVANVRPIVRTAPEHFRGNVWVSQPAPLSTNRLCIGK